MSYDHILGSEYEVDPKAY